jgi:NTP pyrophosphatase (non-canonical NTP hydrolase)
MMDFNEYQQLARQTAVYPDIGNNIVYPTLGLAGETGEFVEKIKKMIRDDDGTLTPERKEALVKELGDVLWYVSNICCEAKISLDHVASINIEKLQSRYQRGVVKGDGDNR